VAVRRLADLGQLAQHGFLELFEHRPERTRRLGSLARRLDVDPDRPVALARVVVLHQPLRRGRLARLPAGVEREVLALVDEIHHPAEPPLGWQHVVLPGKARAAGVE
jgi:hypothetical protein